MPHQLGNVLGGKYRLRSILGEGAMGVVYEADQLDQSGEVLRQVALKTVQPGVSQSDSFAKRFRLEIRVSAKLSSPNVVHVYDVGETDDQQLFFTMELVRARTLADLIEEGGPLEVARACRIAEQTCYALAEAHGQEPPIIHRDLKPANLFITERDGRDLVKVADFGVAKVVTEDSTGITAAGMSPGTPRYMAPEQCTGQPLDARTDLYTVGILLYEMLTGASPYALHGGPMAVMYRHVNDAPPPLPPSVPRAVAIVVERLLAKRPANRYSNARAVAEALNNALHGPHTSVEDDTTEVHQITAPLLRPWAPTIVGGALLAIVLMTLLVILQRPTPTANWELEMTTRIERLLARAEALTTKRQLVVPEGDNAFETYREVLRLDPSSTAARKGLIEIKQILAREGGTAAMLDDWATARIAHERALEIDPGDTELESRLGTILYRLAANARTAGDAASAVELFTAAAERRHVGAQLALGEILEEGEGVDRNPTEALRWLREAAEAGNPGAQFRIGQLYAKGEGVPRDRFEADLWLLKAERQGHPGAAAALEGRNVDAQKIELAARSTARLEQAERQIEADQLLEPQGDNAVESYRTVLAGDPDNEVARAGLEEIKTIYRERAQMAAAGREWEDAIANLQLAVQIDPEDESIREEITRIETESAQASTGPAIRVVAVKKPKAKAQESKRTGGASWSGTVEKVNQRWGIVLIRPQDAQKPLSQDAALVVERDGQVVARLLIDKEVGGLYSARPDTGVRVSQLNVGDSVRSGPSLH